MNCRWSVFISGHGSNLAALLSLRERYPIGLVVSSRSDAYGVTRAKEAGVEVKVLDTEIDWVELLQILESKKITHIFLAGFMKVVPSSFLQAWKKPIVNLHPSLLPKYPGLKSIERAYKDNSDIGVTVHKVTEDVDGGEILLQEKVFSASELKNYSLAEVTEKVHQTEHKMVCQTVEMLCKI